MLAHCGLTDVEVSCNFALAPLEPVHQYSHAHAAGALYATVLEDELSATLGVSWVVPDERVPMREIVGVDQDVCAELSSRRAQVLEHYDTLAAQWRKVHGRTPTRAEKAALLDDATVRSRLGKVNGAGVDLHERWRALLTPAQQQTINSAVGTTTTVNGGRLPAGGAQLTQAVFESLHGQRSWWTRVHLFAEVARLIDTPSVEAIELEVERIADLCVNLEVDTDHEYAQLDRTKFTSHDIIAAERRVLAAANTTAPWAIGVADTTGLGEDQVEAVTAICAGDHAVTTVIGPAGAGKTTMLKAVASAYEHAQRPVTVLALSAVAAQVVTEETGLPANTIAAWKVGSVSLPRGGLVLVDEASMVPTMTLDQLVRVASAYQCRVAFVGDYAQMGAPEAGGLLRDLASERSAVHMTSVRRFTNDWERAASKQLRRRDPDIADTYNAQGRIIETVEANAFESLVDAWVRDTDTGLDSMIIVDSADQAADVSARCQQHLVTANQLGATVAHGADGNLVRLGDLIQSRKNTRELRTSDRRRVLNRDVWKVTGYDDHGGVIAAHTRRGTTASFTAEYTSRHVVLAYATTMAGAQGRTVDTGHALVTPRTAAAALYVALTRGRLSNHAHVISDGHLHEEFGLGHLSGRDAFAAAIERSPEGQLSATSIRARWAANRGDRQLARDADRVHQHAVEWWTTHRQTLEPVVVGAIANQHHHVLGILERVSPSTWVQLVTAAGASTDWHTVGAGERFVATMATMATLATTVRAADTQPAPVTDDQGGPQRSIVADDPVAIGATLTAVIDISELEASTDVERASDPAPARTATPSQRAARWWNAQARIVPGTVALTVAQQHTIVALLTRLAPTNWRDVITSAAAATSWQHPHAGAHFVSNATTIANQMGFLDQTVAQHWWTNTYHAINDPNITRSLRTHGDTVSGALEQLPPSTWSAQVTRGLSAVDWRRSDAAAAFLQQLGQLGDARDDGQLQADHGQRMTYER